MVRIGDKFWKQGSSGFQRSDPDDLPTAPEVVYSVYAKSGEWALRVSPADGATELLDLSWPPIGTGDAARCSKPPAKNLMGIAIAGDTMNTVNRLFWKGRCR